MDIRYGRKRIADGIAKTVALLRHERHERRRKRREERKAQQLWMSELSWVDDRWSYR